jgi:ATP adenylyltransferase
MDRLWAPWRIEYIKKPKERACILCEIPKKSEKYDRENLLLYRGDKGYIVLNRYPYNNGHLMIVPYRHVQDLLDLDDNEIQELMHLTKLSIKIIRNEMKPEGFNIGINIGSAAGAGIEEHIHIHIVPRWIGDTNFMPIIANTKVLIEYLQDTYDKLKNQIESI